MGKYDKFGEFLKRSGSSRIRLSFDEIETIIDARLPSSKQYPAWWSNNPWNSVMTKAWLGAGFKSADVDVRAGQVSFVRVNESLSEPMEMVQGLSDLPQSPLFGSMKGTNFIAEGVDLTQPADPDWGRVYDDDYIPPGADDIANDTSLSIASKIRTLDSMGIARAQIARILGKRYQHVRNVLERDQRKAS